MVNTSVMSIFVNAKFDVLAERLIKLGKVVFVFSDLTDKVHSFLHNVLANDLEDFVLLESLTGDVKRKIFRVDNTLDEVVVVTHTYSGMRSSQSSIMKTW